MMILGFALVTFYAIVAVFAYALCRAADQADRDLGYKDEEDRC